MKIFFLFIIMFIIFLTINQIEAQEIGFLEDFSLAKNRKKILTQLIPGTTDYYYYNCLYLQHEKKLDETDEFLEQWIKRDGYTSQVNEIMNRQALLRYNESPSETLDYIQEELNLLFDHQKEIDEHETNYSSSLNQKLINTNILKKRALSRYQDLSGIENEGLEIINPDKLNPDQRRNFLSRIKRPDIKNLPKLVIDDLKYPHSRGFGSHEIHKLMFKDQFEECLKRSPKLINNSNFIYEYIKKLAPADNIDINYNIPEKKSYLQRLWNFAQKLKQSHNSLKANVLYNLLDINRKQDNYDKKLFLEYVKLPRNVYYMNQKYIRNHSYLVNLNANYEEYSLLLPIVNDEKLVKDYLSQFFINKDDHYETYINYLDEEWLKNIFAETKIVNMIGDMEEWYSLISQHKYQAIKDRVDIDFASNNKKMFSIDNPVELNLYIKNVKTLIVKIFEINTFNYYNTHNKELNTSINLDGLSSTHEKIFKYDASPFLRSLKTFHFPEINKPGVFVVEFIGNGKSSRALIRKGKLFFIETIGASGHEFKIYDDMNQERPDAVIKFENYEFKPDEEGIIIIPFSTNPKYQSIIIQDNDFCSLSGFDHLSENYSLNVGFYVDRESLLPGVNTKVLIRPELNLNDIPISISLLSDITLFIESTDIFDVCTSTKVKDFKLFENMESIYEFKVPENLSKICFELKAKIKNISKNKKEDLYANAKFELNGMDQSNTFENLLLNHEKDSYSLEVLGKNGEPRINRSVEIELKHKYFCDRITKNLKTDNNGCIQLGALKDIDYIKASCSNNNSYKWNLCLSKIAYPKRINSHVNDIIQIPYIVQRDKNKCSLFEKRKSGWHSDLSHVIKYKDGHIQISGLEPGNYEFIVKPLEISIEIFVDKGVKNNDIILSEHRGLKINKSKPIFINSINIKDKNVLIHIGNVNDFTRLHVLATRYLPEYSIFNHLPPPENFQKNKISIKKPLSYYISGRNIGDEYRYILDRKYVDKYPGNMLSKPGLLLNPWSIRKTKTEKHEISPDEKYKDCLMESAMGEDKYSDYDDENDDRSTISNHFSNINYLNQSSLMLFNLKPKENGYITIDKDQIKSYRHLHFMLVDPLNSIYYEISLPKSKIVKKDLRLKHALDSKKHFTEQKRITILNKNGFLKLPDITTSKFGIYDSIDKVFNLLSTLSNNNLLSEFDFILRWPELSNEEKQKKYSEKSCHELNFFLYHKDQDFFNRVILPYIKNKKDKTFMDIWLSGGDLSSYEPLFEFSKLNIAEKILFARRDSKNKINIKRYVNDLFDMTLPDVEKFNHLFEIALKGKALDIEDDSSHTSTPSEHYDEMEVLSPETSEILYSAPMHSKEAMAAPAKKLKKSYYSSRKQSRTKTRPFFKKLDKTKEWAENNYYKLPIKDQNSELIEVNGFWKDFAENDPKKPFLSKNFIYATKNFTEIMLALSVLNLPFKSNNHNKELKGTEFLIQAKSPIIVFHKEILQTELSEKKDSILVDQNFFRLDDRYLFINNEQIDKFVENEFLCGISYGAQIVLSNPTSSNQKLLIMYQIPEGSIPINKGKYTGGIPVRLKPFSTKSIEYYFYFPNTGNFSAYPVQVAKNEKCIASTKLKKFKVVKKLTKIDTQSWEYVSQHGKKSDVIDYLQKNNLNRIDLNKIAFRMKNKSFFEQIINLLKSRQFFHPVLWSYGIYHKNQSIISEYLQNSHFAKNCGLYIHSPLLIINPIRQNFYEHLEYAPLVNARAHQIGKKQSILNNQFFKQYKKFLKLLSYRPVLDANDLMAVTCYLLTQDRIKKAISFFERINKNEIKTTIQYDYIHAYILMFQEKTKDAERVIAPYLNYPVTRWQKLFMAVSSQLDEIQGKAPRVIDENNRNQTQTQLAATEKSFKFKIEANCINISYQNILSCQINYYPMDIELLFSRNPFVQKQTDEFMFIQPAETKTITLPEDKTVYSVDLPEKYNNSNLIIEISANGKRQSQVYYSNSLYLQTLENYGQLKLNHSITKAPLAKAYVKVYAKMKNKKVNFHKDGYTDLRGYFDYVSLNTEDLDNIEKFAILVIDEKYGAVTREVKVPKR